MGQSDLRKGAQSLPAKPSRFLLGFYKVGFWPTSGLSAWGPLLLAGPESPPSRVCPWHLLLGLCLLSDTKYTNKSHFAVSRFPRLFLLEISTSLSFSASQALIDLLSLFMPFPLSGFTVKAVEDPCMSPISQVHGRVNIEFHLAPKGAFRVSPLDAPLDTPCLQKWSHRAEAVGQFH